MITDDDVSEVKEQKQKEKVVQKGKVGQTPCKYGEMCYQTNPVSLLHLFPGL